MSVVMSEGESFRWQYEERTWKEYKCGYCGEWYNAEGIHLCRDRPVATDVKRYSKGAKVEYNSDGTN